MSPGGTAAISMPVAANFMCTGLVTVASFFGSTKNTVIFFALAIAGALRLRADEHAEPGDHHENREHELLADFHKHDLLFAVTF